MLKDLLCANRSYRSFDQTVKIPIEALREFVDCARLSPSSVNLQAVKFRLVYTIEECASVLPLTRWAGKLRNVKLPPVGHEPVAYIILCTDTSVTPTADNLQKDVGICAQTVMLAATEAGFGGCMIGSFSKEELHDTLSLPSHLTPQLVLALGKPDEAVVITDPSEDGCLTYYRKGGVHYVPKRMLDDLIIQ